MALDECCGSWVVDCQGLQGHACGRVTKNQNITKHKVHSKDITKTTSDYKVPTQIITTTIYQRVATLDLKIGPIKNIANYIQNIAKHYQTCFRA